MRKTPILAAAALALAALLSCLPATRGLAQADQRALDQLGPAPGGAARPAPAPQRRPVARPAPGHPHPNGPHQTLPPLKPTPAKPKPAPLVVPPAPPPVPVLPPPIVVPTRPVAPPPPPPVSPDAPDTTAKTASGLRVTFGADRTDLNPATEAALRALVHDAPPGPDTTFTVTAFAAGSPDDPSTPRRLSLSRALAVRSVLVHAGVASTRIYVKALGASSPLLADGPPDRVDVTVTAPPAPASNQKAAP